MLASVNVYYFSNILTLCWRGLEYDDYISCWRLRPPPTKKSDILSVTLNCFECGGSNSGDLGREQYPFIVIAPMFTLIRSMGQKVEFENYSYSIGPCAKKRTVCKKKKKKYRLQKKKKKKKLLRNNSTKI